MFVTLRQVEDRSWLIPSCQGCPPPPHVPQKPTYDDLKRSAKAGCEKCGLFVRGIEDVCSPDARAGGIVVEWSWNYSVLTGRRRGWATPSGEDEGRDSSGGDNDGSMGTFYEIEFSIDADSKSLLVSDPHLPTEFHVGHPVPESTDSGETLSQIRNWYTACVASHAKCRLPSGAKYMPTRLLDIQSPDCESGVRLLDTAEDITVSASASASAGIEYVCLSHCWGSSKPECITLSSTLSSNRQGIAWSSIPRTFRDVISLLRRLALPGLRYLWIDSICIVQDSPIDWAREAAEMCNVYSCAALTIAATNAPDSGRGLFSSSSSSSSTSAVSCNTSYYRSRELRMRLNDENRSVLRVWARRPLPHFAGTESHAVAGGDRTEEPPLLTRGWVLQERLLSRRVVHFARNEVVWECLHGSECQCLGGGGERMYSPKVALGAFLHASNSSPPPTAAGGTRIDTGYETSNPVAQWLEVVEEYTKLSLTFATDKFPALSGAARRSRQFRTESQRYYAGLWEREMVQGLAWCARGPLRKRSDEWIAPTWSWASVESGVWWPGKYFEITRTYLEIESFEAMCVPELEDADPMGRLRSATLTITGALVSEGILLWEKDLEEKNLDEMFSIQFGARIFTGCFWPDYALYEPHAGDERVEHGSRIVWLALLEALCPGGRTHEYTGLILRESRKTPGAFERIGRLRIEDTEKHEFIMARARQRKLVIV